MTAHGPSHPTFGRWTTRDELDFLARLGQHSNGLFLGQRRALLLGYRRGLGLRRVWAGLDQGVVLLAADRAAGPRRFRLQKTSHGSSSAR